ncbi:MAG: pyridoxal-dependent decarboxylase [Xanthomonadales bacterium]|jgi:aromatic-L-amino-acid decarboxylase|nr:pyridoxal-dependent decarboxylase [Xanthomonadales bacterium]
MKRKEYYRWSERAARWGADYLETLRDRPVRSSARPGEIAAQLPEAPPEEPADMDTIFADFERIVPGGMTHWQHPRFFAYFPANAAPVSMVAEQLATVMAAQCMLWQTSPAATEIETRMVDWMRQAVGLPEGFHGTIQDTATTATLCALLTMRERALDWRGNDSGLAGEKTLRVYASPEAHSSIDKSARLSGIGQRNLVKVATDEDAAVDPEALRRAIEADLESGMLPAGVVLCIGGTSTGASDRLAPAIAVAREFGLYVHIDAAWAGSAMICPELRTLWDGVEQADSIVFNPHKWLGAQFDCSIQFLADPAPQVRTLGIQPDYLKTLGQGDVIDYNEWTIPLGRRFRALKLWFLLRAHGLEDLRQRVRNHIAWAAEAEQAIASLDGFEIVTQRRLSLFTFRYAPDGEDADRATERLLRAVNDDGRTYLTQTTHRGHFVIRFQVGQFDCTREDVMTAVEVLRELA